MANNDSLVPHDANRRDVATSLLQGSKGLYEIAVRLWPTIFTENVMGLPQVDPRSAALSISEHTSGTLERLGLQLVVSSRSDLILALENLDAKKDRYLKQRVLEFLSRDPHTIFDGREFYRFLNDFARLVNRHAPVREKETLFALPFKGIPDSLGKQDEWVILKNFKHERIVRLARQLPRDRPSLEAILSKHLPEFEFTPPSEQDFASVSLEKLAIWALVVRVIQKGNYRMRQTFRNLFLAMNAGASKNFFAPSNDTDLYRLAFELDFTFFDGDTYQWSSLMKFVAINRKIRPGDTFNKALYSTDPALMIKDLFAGREQDVRDCVSNTAKAIL